MVHGKPISPGLAEGMTYVHKDILHLVDMPAPIESTDIDQEFRHLESSTATITDDLLALATRVEQEMDANLAAVFDAHQQMLNDPALKEELRAEIRENLERLKRAMKSAGFRAIPNEWWHFDDLNAKSARRVTAKDLGIPLPL